MSSSSSKSSLDSGRRADPIGPGTGGSGGTVSGAAPDDVTGRTDGGTGAGAAGGEDAEVEPSNRSPVVVGAAATGAARGTAGVRCGSPGVKAPAADVPAGT